MQQGEVGRAVALPPLEHVVAADVVLVAEGGEGGDADAEPGQAVEQGDADAAGLHGDARGAGARMARGEGGVEAQLRVGVGDAEAVGADEAHAVRAAGGEQGPRLVGVQARGDDEDGAYAGLAALLGGAGDRGGGYGEDREVGGLGQGADRGVARHGEDRARGGVHREQAARVAARVQLMQDRPADRARLASGADDGDRPRPQQRFEADDVGGAAAFLHGRQIGVALVEGDGAAHLGALEVAGRAQAEIGEELQHLVVLAECVGGEDGDALGASGGDEVLDQEGADAAVVQPVGDRDGDVRRGPGPAGVVLGEADHPASGLGEQRSVPVARVCAGPVGGHRGGATAQGEEPQAQILLGHLLVQPLHLIVVAAPHRADTHGGAVREQGMDRGPAERVVRHHGNSFGSSGSLRASSGIDGGHRG